MSMDKKTLICNSCGKEMQRINGIVKEDFIILEKQWGYFSKKDGQVDEICLCEECYDKWTKNFKLSAKKGDAVELI